MLPVVGAVWGWGRLNKGLLSHLQELCRPCKISQKIQSRAPFGSCHTVDAKTLSVLDLEAKKTTQRGFIWSLLTAQTHRIVKFWRRERWRRWEADCVPSLLGAPRATVQPVLGDRRDEILIGYEIGVFNWFGLFIMESVQQSVGCSRTVINGQAKSIWQSMVEVRSSKKKKKVILSHCVFNTEFKLCSHLLVAGKGWLMKL